MSEKVQVFAIIRYDEDQEGSDKFTIVKILTSIELAESEVTRLNQVNASRGSRYFWQTTKFIPGGE